eukprot:3728038-Rhodomonas_salina.1
MAMGAKPHKMTNHPLVRGRSSEAWRYSLVATQTNSLHERKVCSELGPLLFVRPQLDGQLVPLLASFQGLESTMQMPARAVQCLHTVTGIVTKGAEGLWAGILGLGTRVVSVSFDDRPELQPSEELDAKM